MLPTILIKSVILLMYQIGNQHAKVQLWKLSQTSMWPMGLLTPENDTIQSQ